MWRKDFCKPLKIDREKEKVRGMKREIKSRNNINQFWSRKLKKEGEGGREIESEREKEKVRGKEKLESERRGRYSGEREKVRRIERERVCVWEREGERDRQNEIERERVRVRKRKRKREDKGDLKVCTEIDREKNQIRTKRIWNDKCTNTLYSINMITDMMTHQDQDYYSNMTGYNHTSSSPLSKDPVV